jgi:hypothetical protein
MGDRLVRHAVGEIVEAPPKNARNAAMCTCTGSCGISFPRAHQIPLALPPFTIVIRSVQKLYVEGLAQVALV